MRRRSPELPPLDGILVLDKDLGISSARGVEIVRRRAQFAKAGHAGTLDPLASGVLVIALGRGTKAVERLMATEKEYLAEVDALAAQSASLAAAIRDAQAGAGSTGTGAPSAAGLSRHE